MSTDDSVRSWPDGWEKVPLACCPKDDNPLIFTFERNGAEFHCMICGGWFGWLAPVAKQPTSGLMSLHQRLQARFDEGERGPAKAGE